MVWNSGQRRRHLLPGQDPLWVGWRGKAHGAGQGSRTELGVRSADQEAVTAWKSGKAKGQEAVCVGSGSALHATLPDWQLCFILTTAAEGCCGPSSTVEEAGKGGSGRIEYRVA